MFRPVSLLWKCVSIVRATFYGVKYPKGVYTLILVLFIFFAKRDTRTILLLCNITVYVYTLQCQRWRYDEWQVAMVNNSTL